MGGAMGMGVAVGDGKQSRGWEGMDSKGWEGQ